MSKALRVEPEADAEITDAAVWYEKRLPGLGFRFLDAVQSAFGTIERHPGVGTPVVGADPSLETRTFLVETFPYVVIYVELADVISVIKVSHGRKSERYWRRR